MRFLFFCKIVIQTRVLTGNILTDKLINRNLFTDTGGRTEEPGAKLLVGDDPEWVSIIKLITEIRLDKKVSKFPF